MKKLPKRTQDVIDAFEASAMDWGWQIDQGSSSEAMTASKKAYEQDKKKLEQHIARIIAKNSK